MRVGARDRRERRDRRDVTVVEREARGQRAERTRERGVIRAGHGVLRVREALQPGALRRPEQQARAVEVEAARGSQLGVQRGVLEQRVRRGVARVDERGHAA